MGMIKNGNRVPEEEKTRYGATLKERNFNHINLVALLSTQPVYNPPLLAKQRSNHTKGILFISP